MKLKSFLSFQSLLILIFSLYACYSFQKLCLYDLEILVDSKSYKEGQISTTTFFNNGSKTILNKSAEGFYVGDVYTQEKSLTPIKIDLKSESGRIEKCWLGDKEIKKENVIYNADLLGPTWGQDTYYNYQIIKLTAPERAPPYYVVISLIIWIAFMFFNRNRQMKNGPPLLRDLVFSGSIFEYLRPLDYILISLTFLISAFITVGCDAASMLNIMIQFSSGIDIYQFQVSHKLLLDYEFLNWPYNPFFLIFYSFFSGTWAKIFINSDPILGFQHIQTMGLKIVNFILLVATSLSVLSFAIDNNYLKTRIRTIFYLCFLNPVIFYVSILFLQLDIAPLYLITLGLLILTKDKINIFNSAFLLGIGLSCKLQNLLLLAPILLASFLVFIFSETTHSTKSRIFRFVSHSGLVLGILICLTQPFKNKNQAFYHLLANFDQTDRLWSTLIVYSDYGLFIYMTMLVVILLTLIHASAFHSKLSKSEIISNIFLMMGMIVLGFSFAHMNTPSTLIQAGTGLFMLMIFKDDSFQRTFLHLSSVLILGNVLFSDVGDITRIFGWHGSYFTTLYRTMPHEDKVKYSSVLFSIANSTMLAFAIIMLKESLGRLKKEG